MKIGIDIDGVLNDEAAFLIDYGTKYLYENSMNYSIDTSKNGTHNIYDWPIEVNTCFWEKYYSIYLASNHYIRQFSSEIISKLYQRHEIHIITARDNHNTQLSQKEVESLTQDWLHKNYFQYNSLVFTKDKRQYIQEKGIDIMIEDNPDLIQKLCKDIPVLCYHTSYNTYVNGKNIFRVNSWYEIFKIIDNSIMLRPSQPDLQLT